MTAEIAVAGAGFSGAVISHCLARRGWRVDLFERRDHVGGNCHTRRDPETGILVHAYGPHIFHTDHRRVWEFVNRFAPFAPYAHRVMATTARGVFALPINLLTINQFFGRTCSPEEARALVASKADLSIAEPRTFEEQALRFVGRDLYETFFEGYTRKQWGREPARLPASVLQRLPLRFNYDVGYYADRFQGIPACGYTELVARMLDEKGVRVHLNTPFERKMAGGYRHVFFSGPLDGFFGYELGRLEYRTLDFESFTAAGDCQGCAVMNYCAPEVPYTRVTEHKHLSPWEENARTVCFREFSRRCGENDIPYYPVPSAAADPLLEAYAGRAKALENVTFVGRLGTYRYLDMDDAVEEALKTADVFGCR